MKGIRRNGRAGCSSDTRGFVDRLLARERIETPIAAQERDMQPIPLSSVIMPMSNVGRGAIFTAAVLVVGAYTLASASDLDRNGALGAIVFSTAVGWVCLFLPILAVALVNRWWALLIALVPLGVEFYLHEATDYVYPFHEDPYPALVITGTGFLLAIYSLGFLLRAAFDHKVYEGWARKLGDKLG